MVEIILTEVLPASRLQGGKVKLKVTCFFFLSWDFKFNYLYVVCEFNKYLWATYSHLSSKISDLCGTRLPLEQPQELRSTFNPFFFLILFLEKLRPAVRQFDTLKRSEQEIWNATQGSVTGQPSIAVLSVVMMYSKQTMMSINVEYNRNKSSQYINIISSCKQWFSVFCWPYSGDYKVGTTRLITFVSI